MSETAANIVAPPPAVAAPMNRLSTATLIIGVPGSGKTTLFKGYAEYLWEVYRKILLLYSWDGGAIPTDVQKRMKQGLIRFWRARTRSAAGLGLETLYLASKGYWPNRINAETGETSPAVQLVAPVTVKYAVSCPKNHPLSVVPSASMITPMFCTPCNRFIAHPELQVSEHSARTKGFEEVGGVGFDGLTSMTDVVLDHMDIQRGEGNIGGEKPAFGGVVVSGNQKFGGNNRADVGFGQTRGHQFVNNSLSIPYLVEGPIFTALAMEATDEGGLPIVGPKLPGRAATDEGSAWFGNVMETGKSPDDAGRPCFTLYLRPFTDPQNRRHLLKTSASPTGVPDFLRDPAIDLHQPYSVVNLGNVFKMLDDDLRRALATNDIPDAPGTPAGIVEYGEALTVETPQLQAGSIAPATGLPPLMTPGRQPAPTMAAPPLQAQTAPAAGHHPSALDPSAGIPSGSGSVAAPSGTAPGPQLMVAKARPKRGTPATPAPMQVMAPVASAPQAPAAPPAAVPAPGPTIPAPIHSVASAAPSGTVPPPPPGMRPPMKAPGT